MSPLFRGSSIGAPPAPGRWRKLSLALTLLALALPATPLLATGEPSPFPSAEESPSLEDTTRSTPKGQQNASAPAPGRTLGLFTVDPKAAPAADAAGNTAPGEATPPGGTQRPPRTPFFPDIDVFLPDGELDMRLNRLVDKVFFEGQVKYDFVDGDIAAFLRYRYYGFRRTYQIGVFDTVEFESLDRLSDEFERIRGFLVLVQWPQTFHRRFTLVAEVDDIFSNKAELARDSGRTNTFLRLGYQLGTPEDNRSNAIVGDTRAKTDRLFTSYRAIGPGDAGFTGALTWGIDELGGDFDYLKLELEALKRFELSQGTFLIGRLHAGTFLHKTQEPTATIETPATDFFSIPRNELFRLDGRDNLRGLDDRRAGTEEVHTTWEFLTPWFIDEKRSFLKAEWQTWYWVVYAGYGTISFERDDLRDLSNYITDIGLGFQSSFQVKDYTIFLSALAAHALDQDGDVKLRFSVKTYH